MLLIPSYLLNAWSSPSERATYFVACVSSGEDGRSRLSRVLMSSLWAWWFSVQGSCGAASAKPGPRMWQCKCTDSRAYTVNLWTSPCDACFYATQLVGISAEDIWRKIELFVKRAHKG